MSCYQHFINIEYLNTKLIILNVFTTYMMAPTQPRDHMKHISLHVRKNYIGAIAKIMVQ